MAYGKSLIKKPESSAAQFKPFAGQIVGRTREFDGKTYKNKAERKALKRAKVAQIKDLMERVDQFVEEYGFA